MKGFNFIISLISIVFFSGFLTLNTFAQKNIESIPSKKIVKIAENAVSLGDPYTAIEYYEVYCAKNKLDFDALYTLANLYFVVKDFKKAEVTFKKVYEAAGVTYPKSLFYYAQSLKIQGKYQQAIDEFKNFKKVYRAADLAKIVDNEIAGCNLAMTAKTINVNVLHLDSSINKPHIEFNPRMIDQNTIMYGSLRSDTIPNYNLDDVNVARPKRSLFKAVRNGDNWVFAGEMDSVFNFSDASTGNAAVSLDGNRIYFSKCFADWQNNIKCDLYESKKDSMGVWQPSVRMPFPVNTEESSSTMPTLGSITKRNITREVLYFASNRAARSEGGYDIWYSVMELKDSTFSKVENVGRKINSVGNEMTPFYDYTTSTLYFSSDFFPGFGGYDIFKSRGNERSFSNPENIGLPFNSSYDDLYYTVNAQKKEEGFFTSNRTGSFSYSHPNCCDDIYSYVNLDYIKLIAKGNVTKDGESVDGATAMLYLVVKDSNSTDTKNGENLILISSDSSNSEGFYFLGLDKDEEYRVIVKKDGYFYKKLSFNTFNRMRSDSIALPNIEMEEITMAPIVFYIYYDFNKEQLTAEAMNTIDTTMFPILEETPDIIVEISSHTDSKGDSIYNMKLSQRRADNVVNYLESKGIERTRLIAKGYGEDKPIADNETEEGMAQNRRTEFTIIGSKDPFSKLNTSEFKIIQQGNAKKSPPIAKPSVPKRKK